MPNELHHNSRLSDESKIAIPNGGCFTPTGIESHGAGHILSSVVNHNGGNCDGVKQTTRRSEGTEKREERTGQEHSAASNASALVSAARLIQQLKQIVESADAVWIGIQPAFPELNLEPLVLFDLPGKKKSITCSLKVAELTVARVREKMAQKRQEFARRAS